VVRDYFKDLCQDFLARLQNSGTPVRMAGLLADNCSTENKEKALIITV
jgi:hypothetical protein